MAESRRDVAVLVAVVMGSFLVACSPVNAQQQCESKWKTTGRAAVLQFFDMICRYSNTADPSQCKEYARSCCIDSDCERGMKCTCQFHCKRMACLHILDSGCDYATEPRNGKVVPVNNTRVRVKCDKNFVNVPTHAFYQDCNVERGRAWRPEIECRRRCGAPTEISNGQPLTGIRDYHVGSTVSYRCNKGYKFRRGVDRSTCTMDGDTVSWSTVQCTIMRCDAPNTSDANNIRIKSKTRGDSFNSRVTFICNYGFVFANSNRSIRCVIGHAGVKWSAPVPTCIGKPCKVPTSSDGSAPSVADQPARSSVASGAQVSFVCPPSLSMIGMDTSTCSQGRWSPLPPQCRSSCCRKSDLQLTGQVARFSDPYRQCLASRAAGATVRCDECYSTSNGSVARSLAVCVNGSWVTSGNRNHCERKMCPPLHLPASTFMPNVQPLTSTLTTMPQACRSQFLFSCTGSKVLVPDVSRVECLPTSSWSHGNGRVECRSGEDSRCPSTIRGVNESELVISPHPFGRQQGAFVSIYRCRDPCMHATRANATCTLNSTSRILYWDVIGEPECKETRCPLYRTWAYARNTRLRDSTMTSCLGSSEVRCRKNYYPVVQGSVSSRVTATCGIDGQWSHSPHVDVRCIRDCDASTCPNTGEECYELSGSPKRFGCRCKTCVKATQGSDAVCGSDGVTYDTRCHLERAACVGNASITVLPLVECNKGGQCWQNRPEIDYSKYQNASINCRKETGDLVTFNQATRQCVGYKQLKCHRNQGNSFTFYRACYDQCAEKRVCHLPAERGPCTGSVHRFFYNCTSSRCERFTYSGCGGNENNFESMERCEMTKDAQSCTGSDGVCAAQTQDCCASENNRLLDMCNTADYAVTGTVDQRTETGGYHFYNILVTGIVYGSGISAMVQGRPNRPRALARTHDYILAAPVVNATSSCQSCVFIPGGQQRVFLMGRLEDGYLYVSRDAFGFVYTHDSEGRDAVCSCPRGSRLRDATTCP